jgi:hypothetical protein
MEGGKEMIELPTPETDAFAIKFKTTCGEKYWVPVDIARKLERERDEAREESLEQARLLGISGERECRIIAERDEARREMLGWENKWKAAVDKWKEAVEMAAIAEGTLSDLRKEKDEASKKADRQESRIDYLESKLNKEINEANQDHLGWENKWNAAIGMAAIAENERDLLKEELINLEDQRDLAMKVIKRLEAQLAQKEQ